MQVAQALELIGGKWNRKQEGFVFPHDPTDLLVQISDVEKCNLKKEFQFFSTPANLAWDMMNRLDLQPDHSVLEPSAGNGALIDAILQRNFPPTVFFCEKMPTNITLLNQKYGKHDRLFFLHPPEDDFLQLTPEPVFDRIIANPPFSNNQDITHIMRMYEFLNDGGKLVTLASTHWKQSGNGKEKAFRGWLTFVGAKITDIEAGTFKESGTNIPTVMIEIVKKAVS